jgi:hypothetical protein
MCLTIKGWQPQQMDENGGYPASMRMLANRRPIAGVGNPI